MSEGILIRTESDVNNYPDVQVFGDFAFYMNGGLALPYYADASSKYTWMHETPTETPTEDHSGAGAMTAAAGGFKYAITEINANTAKGYNSTLGKYIECHETNLSSESTITGNFTSKEVVLTIAATAKNSDATHKNIYGTLDGGDIYYWLGVVAVGTTSFTDNNITRVTSLVYGDVITAVDGTSSYDELNYPAWNHKLITASNKRIFTAGIIQYTTGTVTTDGTTTVMGSGTAWTRAMESTFFRIGTKKYVIDDVVSTTEITLSTAYTGANASGQSYEIFGNKEILAWSALNPIDSHPMWWAFPLDHFYEVKDSDKTGLTALSMMGDKPVSWKERSYTLWTENGNDMIPVKSSTAVGTNALRGVAETSNGTNIFITPQGLIYEATGYIPRFLGIDLSKTVDGIEQQRIQYCQAGWDALRQWFMLFYSKDGATEHDRLLIYDDNIKEYVTWQIEGNCIGFIESTEDGDKVTKPWFGSVGGFYYKMLTGNNFGGASQTLSGTITSVGASTLTDTSAIFYTTDDGLKDIYVSLYDTNGDFQEKQKISSNNATVLTVDTAWTTSPQAGWTYEVGSIYSFWESKVFDFDTDIQKRINDILIGYKKAAASTTLRVEFYYSQDADMVGNSYDAKVEFDLSRAAYYKPLRLPNNQWRFMKFRVVEHGTNHPMDFYSISYNIKKMKI